MPRSAAIRAAVRGWSPVIISTRTPAACASAIAARASGARRVDDPDQPEVDQLALDRLVLRRSLVRRAAAGRRRRACAARGRRAARPSRGSRSGASSVSGRTSPPTRSCGAAREQHVGRALGDDGEAELAGRASDWKRAHQLALGGERHLADALEPRARALRCSPSIFASATRNAASVGSPWIVHSPSVLAQHGVVRQAAGREHGADLVEQDRLVERPSVRRAARPRAGSRCR